MAPTKMQTFRQAVEITLNNWTALQLAVEHQAGGPDSMNIARWMIDEMENYFYLNDDLEAYEVADCLTAIMDTEFNTRCEDGSLEEVSGQLCRYFSLCKAKKDEEVKAELAKQGKCNLASCKAVVVEDTEMEAETSKDMTADVSKHMEGLTVAAVPIDTMVENGASDAADHHEEPDDGWNVIRKGKKHS